MRVNIDELADALALIEKVNSVPLDEIEWMDREGNEVTPDHETVQEWKFVGLSNATFASTHILLES